MKRIAAIMAAVLVSAAVLNAKNTEKAVFERTYISTDKDVYVAGDRIWCSAFCFRADSVGLSDRSAVAYVEIVADGGLLLQSAKISLDGGRGSGYLDLPESMPSGNYRLFAFTKANRNEDGYDFLLNSKVISVLNAKFASKEKNKVEIVSDEVYAQRKSEVESDPDEGEFDVSVPRFTKMGGRFNIDLSNSSGKTTSLSVSVYKDDGIAPAEDRSIASFVIPDVSGVGYTPRFKVETEGEIILATISGRDRDEILKEPSASAYISTPGSNGDTYTAGITQDGRVEFMTSNIYGSRELVTEVADLENEKLVGLVDLESPFVGVKAEVPMMAICQGIGKDVIERGRQMQSFHMEYRDSLSQFTARREDYPYTMKTAVVYNLDDYTRFPTLREVLVEITPEVRVRGRNNKQRIQVLTKDMDAEGSPAITWRTSLVLLDGVPVFKHSDMMNYDAMLLSEVHVWREKFIFGNRQFPGVVNFISKRGNMAFMDFGSNVRIIDYQGICYPMDYTVRYAAEGEKDMRQTIFWKPEVEIAAGETLSLECQAPDYFGRFVLVVEGVTEDGEYIHKKTTFVVE